MILQNISFSYTKENPVLNKFSFDFTKKGFTYIITGRNGSGKSTLLNIICSLIKDYEGSIVNNVYTKIRANLNFHGLDPSKNGIKNINLLELERENDFFSLVKHYSDKLSMTNFLSKKVSKMSTGMQLKTKYILMLSAKPDLLIFDEPLNSLDKESEYGFIDIVNELNETGQSCIMTMHLNDTVSFNKIRKNEIINLDPI
jgi:ABC-2 type transport system ATP-binding protein